MINREPAFTSIQTTTWRSSDVSTITPSDVPHSPAIKLAHQLSPGTKDCEDHQGREAFEVDPWFRPSDQPWDAWDGDPGTWAPWTDRGCLAPPRIIMSGPRFPRSLRMRILKSSRWCLGWKYVEMRYAGWFMVILNNGKHIGNLENEGEHKYH